MKFSLAATAGATDEQLEQASEMHKAGLQSKAVRTAHCGVLGQRKECIRNRDHRFYVSYRCGNRYCRHCGPHVFAMTFAKYAVLAGVAQSLVPHWPVHGRKPSRVIAKIDITIRNAGTMPTPKDVQSFNKNIRRFFRLIERRFGISRKQYGVVWCDEFGGSNSNLHAHGVYAGPWLPQKKRELSRLWSEVVGQRAFVSIKISADFASGLAHALKYPGKYVSRSTPQRLAQLEKTIHRVRRVHTLARFYNVKSGDASEPIEGVSSSKACPLCGGGLMQVCGWKLRTINELNAEGLQNFDTARLESNRAKVLSQPRGSP